MHDQHVSMCDQPTNTTPPPRLSLESHQLQQHTKQSGECSPCEDDPGLVSGIIYQSSLYSISSCPVPVSLSFGKGSLEPPPAPKGLPLLPFFFVSGNPLVHFIAFPRRDVSKWFLWFPVRFRNRRSARLHWQQNHLEVLGGQQPVKGQGTSGKWLASLVLIH